MSEIPGEKLVIKIWETLFEKGIGGLLAPWQIKREGRALLEVRRDEKLVLAQAEKDAQDILAGRKTLHRGAKRLTVKATPAMPSTSKGSSALIGQRDPAPQLLNKVASQFSAREVQRFVNLQRIAIHAEEQARHLGDDEISDEAVDPDWLNRWRENAQDVSAEHMQKVWARILAEEVKVPGSYSMGTLEFLRTLSKTDALKIAAIGPYVIADAQIYRDQPFLDRKGVLFSDLLELQEMGVLSGVEAIGLTLSLGSTIPETFQVILPFNNKGLFIVRQAIQPALQLNVYRVTKLGREILRLGDYKADDDYCKYVGSQIKAKGFTVKYGDYIQLDEHTAQVKGLIEL